MGESWFDDYDAILQRRILGALCIVQGSLTLFPWAWVWDTYPSRSSVSGISLMPVNLLVLVWSIFSGIYLLMLKRPFRRGFVFPIVAGVIGVISPILALKRIHDDLIHPQYGVAVALLVSIPLLGFAIWMYVEMYRFDALVSGSPTVDRISQQVSTMMTSDAPASPASAGNTIAGFGSMADEILKFGQLRDQGLISEEDFELQRARLLGRPASSQAGPTRASSTQSDSQSSPPPTATRSCSSCGKQATSAADAFCRRCGGPV